MTDTNQNYPWIANYPDDVDWNADILSCPVYKMLDHTAAKFPDAPAFDFLGVKQNWSEIDALTKKFACGLQDIGVSKGTKVGIFLPNCPLFLVAYYALMRLGAVVVNYNPLYASEELANMIEDSETDVIITLDLKMLYNKIEKMLSNTRLEKIVVASFTDMLPFPKNYLFKLVKRKELVEVNETSRIFHYQNLIDNDGDFIQPKIDPKNDVALYQYTVEQRGYLKR